MDVLCNNFGDPQIAKRSARRLDGLGCGFFPGLSACADQVCHSVNAHASLLANADEVLPVTVLAEWCSADKKHEAS